MLKGIYLAVYAAGSQEALATALGVPPPMVEKWCAKGFVPPRRAEQIEQIYGVARAALLRPIRPKVQRGVVNTREHRAGCSAGISAAVRAAGSQMALAKMIGVTQQAIHQWESKGFVPLRRAQEIEALYGIDRTTLVNPRVLDAMTRFAGME